MKNITGPIGPVLPGEEFIHAPITEVVQNMTDKNIERMARTFIMGSDALGKRRKIQQTLEKKVVTRIGRKGTHLVDKLFELIEGVYILDKKSDGREIRYYQVPPNLNAIVYALDRVLGKPVQHTEHTEEKRGVMVIENIIKNLAAGNEDKPSATKEDEEKRIKQFEKQGNAFERSKDFGEFREEDGEDVVDVRASEVSV